MFDLVADAPEAGDVFAVATKALGGRDPRDVVSAANEKEMRKNGVAQVLCCTQALAVWSVLRPRLDARLVVAGYSVGEVAAWGVAGALTASAAIEATVKRAALMDVATNAPSSLLALRGLANPAIGRLCDVAGVHVAIRNAPERVVVGGTLEALDRVSRAAQDMGAVSVTPVSVGVASHTPLLRDAAEQFGAYLQGLGATKAPDGRLLSGIDGDAVYDVQDGLAKLARQIAQTIEWAECLESCRSFGATRALELGPGDSLARMMGGVLGERNSRSVAEFRSLEGLLGWIGPPYLVRPADGAELPSRFCRVPL